MKKKSAQRKLARKRSHGKDQPKTGSAGPGETFNPRAVPGDRESDERSRPLPCPAPAPGVPVSHEEYERLKERAKTVRKRPPKHVQEDPSEKK